MKEVFKKSVEEDIEPAGWGKVPVITKKGDERIIAWHSTIMRDNKGEIIGVLSSGSDITERVHAEEALKRSRDELEKRVEERTSKFASAMEQLEQEVEERSLIEEELQNLAYTLSERIKELNCLYGFSEIVENNSSLEKIMEGIVKLIPQAWQYPEIACAKVTLDGQEWKTENFKETEWKLKSNIKVSGRQAGFIEVCYLEERSVIDNGPFQNEEMNLINSIAGRIGGIIEWINAEEAMRKSEERYRSLVQNIPDIVYSSDQDGHIIDINLPGKEFLGYSSKEMIVRYFLSFVHLEDKKKIIELSREVIKKQQEFTKAFECRMVAKDGSIHWVEANIHLQFNKDKAFLRADGVIRDITQTKLMRDHLIRSERLAATGELAASVAHEINSPLQAIGVMLRTLQDKYSNDEALSDNINLLIGAFGNIRDTVKNLLDLNRPGKEVKQPTDVNQIIEKTVDLVRSHLQKNMIDVKLNLSTRIPNIMASPQQLNHLFLNLINNAVEAISGASKSKDGDPGFKQSGGEIRIQSNLRKGNLVIQVSDSGPGIPEGDLHYIFDPFYTSKKRMGMGVGLSLCHGIIEDHKGSIIAKNSTEGGALFVITLRV